MQTEICYKRANFDYTTIILQQNASDTRSLIDIHRSNSVKQKCCKAKGAQFVEIGRTMGGNVNFADIFFDVGNQVCSLQT